MHLQLVTEAALAAHHAASQRCIEEKEIKRITVNWIRHNLFSYDGTLDAIGDPEIRFNFKKRVLGRIARIYPELKDECQRQVDMVSSMH